MTEIELKPCPFCGGEAHFHRNNVMISNKSEKCAWVHCNRCGAKTKYFLRKFDKHYMRSANEAWNRRTDNDR